MFRIFRQNSTRGKTGRTNRSNTMQNRLKRFQLEKLEAREMFSANGDFNGDGFADLAIAATGQSVNGHAGAGAVSIIYGSSNKLTTSHNQIWTLDSDGIHGVSHAYDAFGSNLAIGDFNGDGYDDLAIGTQDYRVGGKYDAGVVNIIFGSKDGLTSTGNKQYHLDTSGINGVVATDAHFGSALAAGDFNHDGRDDLAIAAEGEAVGKVQEAGAVHILYGSSKGLKTTGDQLWSYASSGVNGYAAEEDHFGCSLAVGDFNHDGREDLAIGAWSKDFGVAGQSGAVTVLYSNSDGLSGVGDQFWRQGHDGLVGTLNGISHFGYTIAAGDFDGDGYDDLAMAAPSMNADGVFRSGEFAVLYGSASKLSIQRQQLFTSATLGLTATQEFRLGTTMVAGDFNGDGRDELVVNVTGYDLGGANDVGLVVVIQGAAFGLTSVNPRYFTQDTANITDQAETADIFGYGLTSGDYNGDGRDDLVIAAPYEDVGDVSNAGAVHVLYGSTFGPATAGSQYFTQDTIGMLGAAEADDWFGGPVA